MTKKKHNVDIDTMLQHQTRRVFWEKTSKISIQCNNNCHISYGALVQAFFTLRVFQYGDHSGIETHHLHKGDGGEVRQLW